LNRQKRDEWIQAIDNKLKESAYYCAEVIWLPQTRTLQVYIDRIDGNTCSLNDCVFVTKAIDSFVDSLAPDQYTLEVSSPGLERPLRKLEDFKKFLGKKIRLVLSGSGGRKSTIVGILKTIDELGNLAVEVDGTLSIFSLQSLIQANLVYDWE
jgi:ribosome maturation factor RimP